MLHTRVESFLPVSETYANAATRSPALSLKELGEEQEKDKKVKQSPDGQRQGTRSMWMGAMRGRRYLLEHGMQDSVNSNKEGTRRQRSPDWLYESYCRMSQQHPLIVFLLLIVMGTCLALLAVFFGSGLVSAQWSLELQELCFYHPPYFALLFSYSLSNWVKEYECPRWKCHAVVLWDNRMGHHWSLSFNLSYSLILWGRGGSEILQWRKKEVQFWFTKILE